MAAAGTLPRVRQPADPSWRTRSAALALVAGLHLGVLALLIGAGHAAKQAPITHALSVFDLPPPPPPPSIAPPPRARIVARRAEQAAPAADRSRTLGGGGAGGSPIAGSLVASELPPLPTATIAAGGTTFATIDLGSGADGATVGGSADGGNGVGPASWGNADWIARPSDAEWFRAWPPAARTQQIGGRVSLLCIVPQPGRPDHCRVLEESPHGYGFGKAALQLSQLASFQLRPVTDGRRERGDVPIRVPIVFASASGH